MRRLDGNSLGYIKVFSAQRIRSKGNWTRRHRPAALFFFPLSPTATQPTEKQLLRRCLNAFARFRERASFCPPAHRPDDGCAPLYLRDMRAAADGIISSSLPGFGRFGPFHAARPHRAGQGRGLVRVRPGAYPVQGGYRPDGCSGVAFPFPDRLKLLPSARPVACSGRPFGTPVWNARPGAEPARLYGLHKTPLPPLLRPLPAERADSRNVSL